MQQTSPYDGLMRLLEHNNFVPAAGMLVGVVAIVAIAVSVTVIAKLLLSHRQRMAMIARGMHPDAVITEVVEESPHTSTHTGSGS
jgi:hypothetical protein